MKEYRHYGCDCNHSWVLMRESDALELLEDTFCPWGHEAIFLRKRVPTRSLQVSIRPAEETDDLDKVSLSNRFYLVLTDLSTNKERMSKQTFTANEMSEALRPFYALSALNTEQGWRLMDKMEELP